MLKEILHRAVKEKWAVGHFNASELDQMRAIIEACAEVGTPAMIGMSEGEREHFGLAEAVAVRDAFRNEFNVPIFLNADHTHTVEAAKKAIDAGFDSVHIDLSKLPLAENKAGTKEIVDYARAKNAEISVEGEVGYLVTDASQVRAEVVEVPKESLATPELAHEFVAETGVDRLAPAVGSFHGISESGEKKIEIDLIRQIRAVVSEEVALVLHGGSGLAPELFRAAVGAGMNNIHINTELRVAFVGGLKKDLADHPNELAMYKLDKSAMEDLKKVVKEKLELFGAVNRV